MIREHPFFAHLDEAFVGPVASCAREARFETEEYLVREGEPANQLYLIRGGKVGLEISAAGRGNITFQAVREGEVVGVSWLIPPYRWMYDAKALEPTLAISIDADCLRQKSEANHDLGYEMMKRLVPVLVQRLQATRLQILDVYGTFV
jgi:CRP-like cAMP-binding protein